MTDKVKVKPHMYTMTIKANSFEALMQALESVTSDEENFALKHHKAAKIWGTNYNVSWKNHQWRKKNG